MSIQTNSSRYSETDLLEFKAHVEKKIAKTQRQLDSLEEQLAAAAESKDNEGDWMDNSSNNADIEMLEVMANRQRVHLIDLQNALQRIYNKSYGICVISGELIDKRRLMAVPTTTKSLAAKMGVRSLPAKKVYKPEVKPKASKGPKIISRIISKPTNTPKPKDWENEDDMDLELEDDLEFNDTTMDLDNFSEEDIDN